MQTPFPTVPVAGRMCGDRCPAVMRPSTGMMNFQCEGQNGGLAGLFRRSEG
ncbi:hypothetical protein BBSC_1587 [Bifidobacterium scardovii JCM 12489 = DSM 13734]|nr:hypothetical protein BBSC_1587 [Bifidobacterium scardovii JCM 12489 = DSM 13734]